MHFISIITSAPPQIREVGDPFLTGNSEIGKENNCKINGLDSPDHCPVIAKLSGVSAQALAKSAGAGLDPRRLPPPDPESLDLYQRHKVN